jgi:polar amino acid transport system substrate-binding protein
VNVSASGAALRRAGRLAARLVVLGVAVLGASVAHAQDAVLRVGVDSNWPPHEFVDASGAVTGFDVELFRAAADAVDLRYQLLPDEWPAVRRKLEVGEIDVSPGVFETAARREAMDFTVPTIWVQQTVFVREGSALAGRDDFRPGDRILIPAGGPHDDEWTARAPPGVEAIRVASSEEGLRRLAAGEGVASIALDTLGLYTIRTLGLELRSIGKPLEIRPLRFAVPRGRAELLARLNDGLALVRRDGTYDRIWERWFGVLEPEGIPPRLVIGALLGVMALAALAFAWSVSLRRQVARRTRGLAEAHAERRRRQRRAPAGEKMEALGRMAAGVAHDFNNVMLAIHGTIELARAQAALPPEIGRSLDEIESAGHSASALVTQLVVFGRGSRGERSELSWNDVVHESEPLLRRLVPERLALRFDLAADAGRARGDLGQLQQVVLNLVLNARDAIAGPGVVTLATRAVEQAGSRWSELSVSDDGPGMDEATQRRIFEPFFSTKGAGRGLGLATVHAVAERHGGHVEVTSRPGAGASFSVRLPAEPPGGALPPTRGTNATFDPPAPRSSGARSRAGQDEIPVPDRPAAVRGGLRNGRYARVGHVAPGHAGRPADSNDCPARGERQIDGQLDRREPRLPAVQHVVLRSEDLVGRARPAHQDHAGRPAGDHRHSRHGRRQPGRSGHGHHSHRCSRRDGRRRLDVHGGTHDLRPAFEPREGRSGHWHRLHGLLHGRLLRLDSGHADSDGAVHRARPSPPRRSRDGIVRPHAERRRHGHAGLTQQDLHRRGVRRLPAGVRHDADALLRPRGTRAAAARGGAGRARARARSPRALSRAQPSPAATRFASASRSFLRSSLPLSVMGISALVTKKLWRGSL